MRPVCAQVDRERPVRARPDDRTEARATRTPPCCDAVRIDLALTEKLEQGDGARDCSASDARLVVLHRSERESELARPLGGEAVRGHVVRLGAVAGVDQRQPCGLRRELDDRAGLAGQVAALAAEPEDGDAVLAGAGEDLGDESALGRYGLVQHEQHVWSSAPAHRSEGRLRLQSSSRDDAGDLLEHRPHAVGVGGEPPVARGRDMRQPLEPVPAVGAPRVDHRGDREIAR